MGVILYSFFIMQHDTYHVGHPHDDLTMSNLLHLTLSFQTFINIPQEIGDRSTRLKRVLGTLFPYTLVSWHHYILGGPDENYILHDSDENYNISILQDWINGKYCEPWGISWKSLADVLDQVGIDNDDLIKSLRTHSASGPPTMSALLHFPVTKVKTTNIPREVGVKYLEFGTHLLQDVTSARIRTLEHQLNRDGERINQHLLEEWLSGGGRPVTWATLVEVLNIIGMGELAKMIEDRYVTTAAFHTS